MSKLGVVLLVLALLIAGAPAAAAPAATPAAMPASGPAIGDIYLALGDSIAAGVGASEPTENGYPALLDGYLRKQAGHAVDLVDLAVPGETSRSFLSGGQLDRALQLIANARSSRHTISPVTLTLGANDLLDAAPNSRARQQALDTLAKNLETIYSRLDSALSDIPGFDPARLYVTNYYDPSGTDPTLPDSDAWWLAKLNQTIGEAAKRAGATLIDINALFRGHTAEWTWYPADIHPNNAGHVEIANAIWRGTHDDTTPPTVSIERPTHGTLSRPIPTIIVKATDRVGVTDVEYTVNGRAAAEIPAVPADGGYAVLWDTRSLRPGRYTIEVSASDAAGNTGTAQVTVTVPTWTVAVPTGATPGAGA